jgi:hypothetical protein
MAAKTPGLFLRSGVYYVRIVLPLDHPLRQQYRSGRVVHSLGACGRRHTNGSCSGPAAQHGQIVCRTNIRGTSIDMVSPCRGA